MTIVKKTIQVIEVVQDIPTATEQVGDLNTVLMLSEQQAMTNPGWHASWQRIRAYNDALWAALQS